MTLGQANAELLMYPQSRERLELLREIAELSLAEHCLYVQENVALQKFRHEDTLFSESFFMEADEGEGAVEVAEQEVTKKRSDIAVKLTKLAYKALLILKKIGRVINVAITKLGVRRQKLLKEMNSSVHVFSDSELKYLKGRLSAYATTTQLTSAGTDDTHSIVLKKQPSIHQVKLKTTCKDKELVNEVRDLLAFGLGDVILARGDGSVINLDTPFVMSLIHAKTAIGHAPADIEGLRGNLHKEQNRAVKDGLLFKIKNKNGDAILSPNLVGELERIGLTNVKKDYENRSATSVSTEDAAYYKKAADLWGEITTAVAKTNTLMNKILEFRTNALTIVNKVIGVDESIEQPAEKPEGKGE